MTNQYVRPMRADDLAALVALIDATGLFPGAMLPDMAAPHLTTDGSGALWLVFDDGSVGGVAYAVPEPMTDRTWNLLLIAVDPRRQRDGIGAALIGAIERLLVDRAARLLLVETSGLPEFDGTHAFYDRLGFAREARIANFYQAGEDKIIFTKTPT